MPIISLSHQIARHSVPRMYKIISNVRQYPQFLPYCIGSKIISKSRSGMLASLDIGYGSLFQSYTSRVTFIHNKKVLINADSHFLFNRMVGEWKLEANKGGTLLDFKLDFEFSNSLYAGVAGMVLDRVSRDILNAFLLRAETLPEEDLKSNDRDEGVVEAVVALPFVVKSSIGSIVLGGKR